MALGGDSGEVAALACSLHVLGLSSQSSPTLALPAPPSTCNLGRLWPLRASGSTKQAKWKPTSPPGCTGPSGGRWQASVPLPLPQLHPRQTHIT